MVIIIIENASELLLPKVIGYKSCGQLVDTLTSGLAFCSVQKSAFDGQTRYCGNCWFLKIYINLIIENASELLLPKVIVYKSCGQLVDTLTSGLAFRLVQKSVEIADF